MNRDWIIAVVILGLVVALVAVLVTSGRRAEPPSDMQPPPAQAPAEPGPNPADFVSLTIPSDSISTICMFWCDERSRCFRTLGNVRDHLARRGQRLRFAMNGGMYHRNRRPVGLYVEHGRELSPLETADGWGNFYLKPNGVFAVRRDHTAIVTTTDAFAESDDIAFATQSGPMLLIDGDVHPVFVEDSWHLNIRNGVGMRPDGSLLFAMSKYRITLYDFATYFRSMGCCNALYLDGFVSRCYFPEAGWEQLDGDFGVIVGVVEKVDVAAGDSLRGHASNGVGRR